MSPLRPAQSDELSRVLSLALAAPDARPATTREQVRAFEAYITATGCRWEAWLGETDAGKRPFGVFLLHLPGRVGVLMMSPIDPGSSAELAAMRHVIAAHLAPFVYIQALIHEEDARRQALLRALGFEALTTLVYYERSATYPWIDPPADRVTWRSWDESERSAFERVIAESYVDSNDCPELTGVRPIADVLASHRAAGVFNPQHWQLACNAGEPVACILLAQTPLDSILEIVYVGVAPSARRQGIGAVLMQRAMDLARRCGARRVTVVVDERNAAARRLYESFAFVEVARRAAFWLRNRLDAA